MTDLILSGLKCPCVQSLSISTYNPFNGTLLPANAAPGQATICDLVQAKLSYLKIGDPVGGYIMETLNGTLPACMLDSQSQLRTLIIGIIPFFPHFSFTLAWKRVAELVHTSNCAILRSTLGFSWQQACLALSLEAQVIELLLRLGRISAG